jgi:two-component system, OmpR family, phosphate regulon sensor histidine kinase PhoR
MTTELATLAALASLTLLGWCHFRNRHARQALETEIRKIRQRNEDSLRLARDERDHLLDALGDAFLLVDDDERIRFANAAALSLFGGRQLVGRPVREAFLDPRLAEALLRCLATGEPVRSRVVLPRQTSPLGDQETRGINAWSIDAAPLTQTDDDHTLARVVIRDVTAEHQLEQIRKDFVANASHELRTPLAIISGYLENLLDDDMIQEPEMARRFLTVMRKHTERISRIVEDMLVISRLESGEAGAINLAPFEFRNCLNDVLERLESVVRQQQAEIVLRLPEHETVLLGDRFYWTQVLFNLIENALKQNPHHGLRVEIGCHAEGEDWLIWVSDDGVGIPSADLPHIFRRFYRVDKHHSQQEIKGTGLGLSIVKRAVEAHHGTISVQSTPGRETKFTIRVPRNPLIDP